MAEGIVVTHRVDEHIELLTILDVDVIDDFHRDVFPVCFHLFFHKIYVQYAAVPRSKMLK